VGPEGRVLAIEPDERAYQDLLIQIRLRNQLIAKKIAPIQLLKVAVYKEDTFLNLYHSLVLGSSSLYSKSEMHHEGVQTEKVRALRIDSIVKALGWERVDFIKMDIEGAEVDALLGAEETISRFKPKLAICTYHRPTDPIEIREVLLKYNPMYCFKEVIKAEKILFAW
jgi:FkbM family methyltransferase